MSSDKRSSAASYNFQHSKGAQKIWLKIQTLLSSTSYKVQASLDLTVKQLTMEISRVLKMDKGNKCLIYGDKVLPEEETLMNLNLPNNALLYLVPEMKTGPINYSVNTEALQKYMHQIHNEIFQMLQKAGVEKEKNVKSGSIFELTFTNDGGHILQHLRDAKGHNQNDKNAPLEINLETWDQLGENDRTRQTMAEINQKLEESKERKKLSQSQRNHNLVFVDAKLVIEEDDWEKLVEISQEKKRKIDRNSDKTVKILKSAKASVEKSSKNEMVEPDEAKRPASCKDPIKVSETKESFSLEKIANTSLEPESNVLWENLQTANLVDENDESLLCDTFFDCNDFEKEDEKSLWDEFFDWVYRNYFHHKVKLLEKNKTEKS